MATREQPCPYRIVDDVGGAFAMGCTAGCIWNLGKGMFRAPKSERLIGGFRLLSKRAPILGGSFALWGGIFSMTDCIITLARNKQSPWNQIAAGAITGGILAIRAGPRVALRNAIFGGLILGCIQIVQVMLIKMGKRQQVEKKIDEDEKMMQEQRKRYSKIRPDMFTQDGKVVRLRA